MIFLKYFLIFALIQLLPVTFCQTITPDTNVENFVKFYEKELYLMAENFSEKAKNLSEILIQTKDIKEASTPELKEFKLYLQTFLQDYEHLKRFKMEQPLLNIIINTANLDYKNSYENNLEFAKKFKKIVKQYFSELLQDYEENYKKFIKEKCLTKFEDLRKDFKNADFYQKKRYTEYVDKIKSCQNFQCFAPNLDALLDVIIMPDELGFYYTIKDFKKFISLLSLRLLNIGQAILKEEKFSKLSLECQRNLVSDIKDFSTKFKNNNNILKFAELLPEIPNFPYKYYNSSNIPFPLKDRVLLNEMFENYKTNSYNTRYELENNDVMRMLAVKMYMLEDLLPGNMKENIKPLLKLKCFNCVFFNDP